MIGVVLALLIVPASAGLACSVLPARVAAGLTVVSGLISFALVLALVPAAAHHDLSYLSYLRVDAVSAIFLLATGFLYGAVAMYAVGYLKGHHDRRFYAGLNLFAWAMLAAPLMSSLALLWIAVEVTTIISALLVAIEDTDGAAGPRPGCARRPPPRRHGWKGSCPDGRPSCVASSACSTRPWRRTAEMPAPPGNPMTRRAVLSSVYEP